jgi:hypothetical protein
VFFTCFIYLEASVFSTKDKVTIHFEANSKSIIAGLFLEPSRSGRQLSLLDLCHHASACSDSGCLLCESETRNHQFYIWTLTHLKMKERNRLSVAHDVCVAEHVLQTGIRS